jgi:uncharacterized protein YndB with AHSA1/START domain
MTMTDSVQISDVVNAEPAKVWAALTTPDIIKTYFFGATVATDWKPGSPITWSGDYKGKPFQDKGHVKVAAVDRQLSMTHWSPLSGLPDVPKNYHTVTYDLKPVGKTTQVTLTQTNLTGSTEDQARKSWEPVLAGIKAAVEG